VGVLMTPFSQTDREGQARIAAFLETFQRLGWIDGRNVRIDVRWAAGDADRIKASAAEMVHSGPAVIVALGSPALSELQQLTSTIPIVFTQVSDAVGGGFVAGQARPGGNITGFQVLEPAISGKWLGLLKEAAPQPEPGGGALRLGHGRFQCGIPACGRSGRAVAWGHGERH